MTFVRQSYILSMMSRIRFVSRIDRMEWDRDRDGDRGGGREEGRDR